jgi:hypothetical protein
MNPILLLSMPSGGEWLSVLLILLLPTIFYCLTLQNTLKAIRRENRLMPAGQVWLLLVPFFNLIWNFIVVGKMADSIDKEFKARNIEAQPRPGYSIGLAYSVCCACTLIPLLGWLAQLASLVCWVIFWIKMNACKNKLLSTSVVV